MEIRKISVFIIAALMIGALITPLVLAATEDNVVITFDPDGDIDINVDAATYNFTTSQANAWDNTTASYFTCYNNGTVAMDVEVNASEHSNEGDMWLNESTSAPSQDEYAIYIKGFTPGGYVNSSYTYEHETGILPDDNTQFGISLLIGTNLSANHSWQTVTVYFRGTQS